MAINRKVAGGIAGAFLALCCAFIAPHEGIKHAAYRDTGGTWTICHGHTKNVHEGDIATDDDCTAFLNEDTQIAITAFQRLVPSWQNIPPDTRKVFVDQIFNSGAGSLKGTVMVRLLNEGKYEAACDRFPLWYRVTVPLGSVKDMRDGIRDGKADCRISANNCPGIIVRRAEQMTTCLKGLRQ